MINNSKLTYASFEVETKYNEEEIIFQQLPSFSKNYTVRVYVHCRAGYEIRELEGNIKQIRQGHANGRQYEGLTNDVNEICQNKEKEVAHFLLFVDRKIFALHGLTDKRRTRLLAKACEWFIKLVYSDDW